MHSNLDFNFLYDSLVNSLRGIKRIKPVTSFEMFKPNSLILRFDVDYSLSNIEELAN